MYKDRHRCKDFGVNSNVTRRGGRAGGGGGGSGGGGSSICSGDIHKIINLTEQIDHQASNEDDEADSDCDDQGLCYREVGVGGEVGALE